MKQKELLVEVCCLVPLLMNVGLLLARSRAEVDEHVARTKRLPGWKLLKEQGEVFDDVAADRYRSFMQEEFSAPTTPVLREPFDAGIVVGVVSRLLFNPTLPWNWADLRNYVAALYQGLDGPEPEAVEAVGAVMTLMRSAGLMVQAGPVWRLALPAVEVLP